MSSQKHSGWALQVASSGISKQEGLQYPGGDQKQYVSDSHSVSSVMPLHGNNSPVSLVLLASPESLPVSLPVGMPEVPDEVVDPVSVVPVSAALEPEVPVVLVVGVPVSAAVSAPVSSGPSSLPHPERTVMGETASKAGTVSFLPNQDCMGVG
jgi:hypothetical protein